jgi:hypothetical protein
MRAWAWWLCNAVCVVVVVLTYWRLYEASAHMANPNKERGWQDKRVFQYGFNKGYGGDRDHLTDGATTSVEEVRYVPKASECHRMVSSHNGPALSRLLLACASCSGGVGTPCWCGMRAHTFTQSACLLTLCEATDWPLRGPCTERCGLMHAWAFADVAAAEKCGVVIYLL